jgi:hypothetical protein
VHLGDLPWARPRHELLLIALVALATLTVLQPPNTQDRSRLCLSRAIVAGRLHADRCLIRSETEDRSVYGGHLYTDKAPGLSVLEIGPAELVRLPPPSPGRWAAEGDVRLWLVHLLTTGVAFLLCIFLVGRVSEGLAPGWGGAALVTFALGTEIGALAITGIDHVLTGALALGAFVLAWARRPLSAGLAAGLAVTTEYEAAAILVVLLAYVALQGWRQAGRYLLGALPGVVLLGAYDWAAFGAPWHLSYRYLGNELRREQQGGVLGIGLPKLHGTWEVFAGQKGLLLASPVLAAAVLGLVLLWRRGLRAEAAVCLAITTFFLIGEAGYFDPYGGRSPGPRFLAAALPFLALGLGPAFARLPRLTTALAAVSLVASTALALTWEKVAHYRESIWGEILRVPLHGGSSRLLLSLSHNVLLWNVNTIACAAFVSCVGVAALAAAVGPKMIERRSSSAGRAPVL